MRTACYLCGLGLCVALFTGCRRSETIEAVVEPEPAAQATNVAVPRPGPEPVPELRAPAPPTNTPTPSMNAKTNEVAIIQTSLGDMVIEFWPEVAPNTVANFIKLARQGFYDGTCFHRIIKDFMIQGGDPLTTNQAYEARWGTGGPGYTIKAEFNDRPHERGVISMARSQHPDSAGSQFFICTAPADSPNMQYLNGKYTAFGKLIRGDDVLEKIANTPVTRSATGELSKPTQRVEVKTIKIVPANTLQ
jgi:peptidyl-prolyl cis-trans isomerase B (cyclophilin B)